MTKAEVDVFKLYESAKARLREMDEAYTRPGSHPVDVEITFPILGEDFPNSLYPWVRHKANSDKKITSKKRDLMLGLNQSLEQAVDEVTNILNPALWPRLHYALQAAYMIGTICPLPISLFAKTYKAKGGKTAKAEKRRKMIRPLVLAEAKSVGKKPSIIAKRLLDQVNAQLEKGDRIGKSTLTADVNAILAATKK
jgi:hypothetical protein